MLTVKKFIIPIFEYRVNVYIFDKWSEIKDFVDSDTYRDPALGLTIDDYSYSSVFINSRSLRTIVHEAVHIKNNLWSFIGYKPQVDNDEIDAYVVTYIYQRILEIFNKHNRT